MLGTTAPIAMPAPQRSRLLCPLCNDPRVAPVALGCTSLQGMRGSLAVDLDGLRLDPTAPPAECGSSIAITCCCGRGHSFCLRLRTLYATTIVETVPLPESITPRDPERA